MKNKMCLCFLFLLFCFIKETKEDCRKKLQGTFVRDIINIPSSKHSSDQQDLDPDWIRNSASVPYSKEDDVLLRNYASASDSENSFEKKGFGDNRVELASSYNRETETNADVADCQCGIQCSCPPSCSCRQKKSVLCPPHQSPVCLGNRLSLRKEPQNVNLDVQNNVQACDDGAPGANCPPAQCTTPCCATPCCRPTCPTKPPPCCDAKINAESNHNTFVENYESHLEDSNNNANTAENTALPTHTTIDKLSDTNTVLSENDARISREKDKEMLPCHSENKYDNDGTISDANDVGVSTENTASLSDDNDVGVSTENTASLLDDNDVVVSADDSASSSDANDVGLSADNSAALSYANDVGASADNSASSLDANDVGLSADNSASSSDANDVGLSADNSAALSDANNVGVSAGNSASLSDANDVGASADNSESLSDVNDVGVSSDNTESLSDANDVGVSNDNKASLSDDSDNNLCMRDTLESLNALSVKKERVSPYNDEVPKVKQSLESEKVMDTNLAGDKNSRIGNVEYLNAPDNGESTNALDCKYHSRDLEAATNNEPAQEIDSTNLLDENVALMNTLDTTGIKSTIALDSGSNEVSMDNTNANPESLLRIENSKYGTSLQGKNVENEVNKYPEDYTNNDSGISLEASKDESKRTLNTDSSKLLDSSFSDSPNTLKVKDIEFQNTAFKLSNTFDSKNDDPGISVDSKSKNSVNSLKSQNIDNNWFESSNKLDDDNNHDLEKIFEHKKWGCTNQLDSSSPIALTGNMESSKSFDTEKPVSFDLTNKDLTNSLETTNFVPANKLVVKTVDSIDAGDCSNTAGVGAKHPATFRIVSPREYEINRGKINALSDDYNEEIRSKRDLLDTMESIQPQEETRQADSYSR